MLSGQPFCSKEHRELYLNTQSKDAIKRLLSSFDENGDTAKPPADWHARPAAPTQQAPEAAAPQASAAPVSAPPTPVAPSDAEPQAAPAPTVDLGALPEAPFFMDRPRLQAPVGRQLFTNGIAEPVPAPVQLPSGLDAAPMAIETPPAPVQTEDEARSEDISIAEPQVMAPVPLPADLTPAISPSEPAPAAEPTWIPAETVHPPSILRAPAVADATRKAATPLTITVPAGAAGAMAPPPVAEEPAREGVAACEAPPPAPLAALGALPPRIVAPSVTPPVLSSSTVTRPILSDLALAPETLAKPAALPPQIAAPVERASTARLPLSGASDSQASQMPVAHPIPLGLPDALLQSEADSHATLDAETLRVGVAAPRVPGALTIPPAATAVHSLAGPIVAAVPKTADHPPALAALPSRTGSLSSSLLPRPPASTPVAFQPGLSAFRLEFEAASLPDQLSRAQQSARKLVQFRPIPPSPLLLLNLPQGCALPTSIRRPASTATFEAIEMLCNPAPVHTLQPWSLSRGTGRLALPQSDAGTWQSAPSLWSTTWELTWTRQSMPAPAGALPEPMPAALANRLAVRRRTVEVPSAVVRPAAGALSVGLAAPFRCEPRLDRPRARWHAVTPSMPPSLPSPAVAPLRRMALTGTHTFAIARLWPALQSGSREQEDTQELARLLAVRPSAQTLMGLPQAHIYAPAPKLIQEHAAVPVTLDAGYGQGPAFHRLSLIQTGPRDLSIPQPTPGTVAFLAPIQAPASPLLLAASVPTDPAQPRIASWHQQPAQMAAIPELSSQAAWVESWTGLQTSGHRFPAAFTFALDAQIAPLPASAICAGTNVAWPSLPPWNISPAIGWASYIGRLSSGIMPPPGIDSRVPVMSSRQRLARALAAGVPKASPSSTQTPFQI